MNRRHVLLINLFFWLLVIIIDHLPLISLDDPEKIKNALISNLLFYITSGTAFYLFYFFVGPFFLARRKIFQFIIASISVIAIFTALLCTFYWDLLFSLIPPPEKPITYARQFLWMFSYHFSYALWGTTFRFAIDWFVDNQKQKELEKQNVTSELALLRSQVNPHFLFNTLNNINSFVGRDPEKASSGIIKLSEIMRYMLYDSNAERVLLDKEIHYIESYIELQRLRLKNPEHVILTVKGNTEGLTLPPMILLPFIENAFKHGRKNVDSPGITINLTINNDTLHFEVVNYLGQASDTGITEGGFGLRNIKRRLDILYDKNYFLNARAEIDKFKVNLEITGL